MKLRLGKTAILILSAGIFVVVLCILGVTRSQQLKEQSELEDELSVSTMRVDTVDVSQLRPELEALQQQIEEGESELDEARDRLHQTVISVDVTDKLFTIAEYSGVVIQSMTNSSVSTQGVEGVDFSTILVAATVTGKIPNIIDFIISLNSGYTTGYIRSVHISIPAESTDNDPTANIQMIVHSYEGV